MGLEPSRHRLRERAGCEGNPALGAALLCLAILASLALTLLVACGATEVEEEVETGRPAAGWNLLIVTLDTTRADVLTPYGGDARVSPHLDALAQRSTVFLEAFSESNLTLPSHLTMFTGLRSIDHGVIDNAGSIPASADTLPEAFQRAGYRTAGFPAVAHLSDQAHWRGFDRLGRTESVKSAEWVTDEALEWLRTEDPRPFFLWVHYYDPHALYQPPAPDAHLFYEGDPRAGEAPPITEHDYFVRGAEHDSFVQKVSEWLRDVRDPEYPLAMYRGEIRYVDRNLARLLTELEVAGVADRTVVVVVADHGESLGEDGIFYAHRGLHDSVLRIPFIVHVPGWPAGRNSGLATTLDLAPTLVDLFDIELKSTGAGHSLAARLTGTDDRPDPDEALVHQHGRNQMVAMRRAGWKLVIPITHDHWLLAGPPRLYELASDPGERIDRSAEQPERVQSMLRELGPWITLGAEDADGARIVDPEVVERLRALGYEEP